MTFLLDEKDEVRHIEVSVFDQLYLANKEA